MCNKIKQVAQLWQGNSAKLDTFAMNVQRYSQTHAQNCILGPPYEGIMGNIRTLCERFNTRKLCSNITRAKMPNIGATIWQKILNIKLLCFIWRVPELL